MSSATEPTIRRILEPRKIYRLTGVGEASSAETWQSCICPARQPFKSESEIDAALAKARSGEYDGILVAHGALETPGSDFIFAKIRKTGATPVLSLPLEILHESSSRFQAFQKRASQHESFLFYLIRDEADLTSAARDMLLSADEDQSFRILAVITRRLELETLLAWLPKNCWDSLRLYFPHHRTDDADLLTTEEVFLSLERAQRTWPAFSPKGPGGLEIHDSRIPSDLELEPVQGPLREANPVKSPEVSFVIPAYNNVRHLLRTLKHIERQEGSFGLFETIVIDDGSTDGTREAMIAYAKETSLPFKFLHLPRPVPREMGDNRFRAGVSRNLGVKHASAPLLQFLDCDILIGSDHVRRLIEHHAHSDIIQAKRLQLTPEATNSEPRHETIIEGRDTYIPQGAYWETFQDKTVDWNSVPAGWKYVSSFCLSVKTEHFKHAGWFKKVHAWYGFEDTDLGMRLIADGRKLFLSPSRVYHQYHRDERSEWGNSSDAKKELLSRTCKIFYHHHLDPRIFNELRVFMV